MASEASFAPYSFRDVHLNNQLISSAVTSVSSAVLQQSPELPIIHLYVMP